MSQTRFPWRTLSLMVVAGWAGSVQGATLAEIRQRGYMVAAVVDETSPFAAVALAKRTGFDEGLLERLRQSVSFEIREKIVAAASLTASVQSGEVDAVVSSIEITPEQQKTLDFAPPVAESTLYYLKRHGDDRIKSVDDLGARRLGIRRGSESFLALTEVEHRLAKAGKALGVTVEYATDAEAYRGLEERRVDYVINDIADLAEIAKSKPAAFTVGQPVAHQTYVAWAVAKGNADLAEFFRAFVLEERTNGDLAALQQRWLGWTFPDLPDKVVAQDWWTARSDRPTEFPIPTLRDPD